MSSNASRHIKVTLCLAALPLLVGSQCAFFFSSGGDSDRKKINHDDEEKVIVAAGGHFGEPPVQGLSFESGALSGVTDTDGTFQYEAGKTVRFFLGDITLGAAVPAKPAMSSKDLVPEESPDSPAAVNIDRLLLSLDSEPADAVITIPAQVRSAAVRANGQVAPAIEFLDFAEDTAFLNSASQLVAVLTSEYPFTASLVGAEIVQQRRLASPQTDR